MRSKFLMRRRDNHALGMTLGRYRNIRLSFSQVQKICTPQLNKLISNDFLLKLLLTVASLDRSGDFNLQRNLSKILTTARQLLQLVHPKENSLSFIIVSN